MGELLNGSPAHRPIAQSELLEWYALMWQVEPAEQAERNRLQREADERARYGG